jgi:sentrin-specific protease 1
MSSAVAFLGSIADRCATAWREALKRPRELTTEDQAYWRRHRRERRDALAPVEPGNRGTLFEDSVDLSMASSYGGDDSVQDASGASFTTPGRPSGAGLAAGLSAAKAAGEPLSASARRAVGASPAPLYLPSAGDLALMHRGTGGAERNGAAQMGFGRPAGRARQGGFSGSALRRQGTDLECGMGDVASTMVLEHSPSARRSGGGAGEHSTRRGSLTATHNRDASRAMVRDQHERLLDNTQHAHSRALAARRSMSAPSPSRVANRSEMPAEQAPSLLSPEDLAALKPYRHALAGAIAGLLETVASAQLSRLRGACNAAVHDAIRRLAFSRCPAPQGIVKAIRTQRPHSIPIGADDEDKAAIASVQRKPAEEVVLNKLDYNIRTYQVRSLEGTEWLNDQVINLYCAMTQQAYPTEVITLGSFLYTKLASGCADPIGDSLRWTSNVDVFAVPRVLVVINEGKHWTLAMLNNRKQRLEYYDSMGSAGARKLELLAAFFDAEWELKRSLIAQRQQRDEQAARGMAVPPLKKKDIARMETKASTPAPTRPPSLWPRYAPGAAVPQQDKHNFYDCGVFTCQFCLCAAQDVSLLSIAQADMPFLRRLIMLELLEGRFLQRA